MENKKTVGDIKKRFEVLNEINSNSSASGVNCLLTHRDPVKANTRTVDSNVGVNIKRTPAFRCDKGIKKPNHILKSSNFNNQLNNIINQAVKKFDNPTNSAGSSELNCNGVRHDSKPSINIQSNGKPSVLSRTHHVTKHPDIPLKPNVNYATPTKKKPTRPNYLPVDKPPSRKTSHSVSESSEVGTKSAFHSELKQVLSSPLPSGPPPKKPPRTFAHNFKYCPDNEFNSREPLSPSIKSHCNAPSSLPSNTMRPIRSKTESQIMLKKLENVLKQHPNLSDRSNNNEPFAKNKSVSKDARDPTRRYGICLGLQESERFIGALSCNRGDKEEHVYAEVSTINKNKTFNNKNQGLHYMSSPVQNVKLILPRTQMGDPSSPVVPLPNLTDSDSKIFESDSVSSNNKKIQSWVNEAYDKVLSKNTDTSSDSDSINSVPDDNCPPLKTVTNNNQEQLTLERKGYLKRVSSHGQYHSVSNMPAGSPGANLFECLLLVGIDMDNVTKDKVPHLLKKYPPQAEVPSFIENCVFPDASEWPPPPTDEGQACYTVILTSEAGGRKYGYCKRVLPEGATVCLPLAYCIISSVKANSFYHKLLEEIEKHHGQSEVAQMNLIRELYHHPYPMPGQAVRVCLDRTRSTETVDVIRRPLNSKKEDTDLIKVLDTIGRHLFIQVLGSLLLERKVILLSHSISTLSHCIEGFQSALGPFTWQYTLISLVPLSMTELIESPTPYLVGLLKPYENSDRELPSFEGIQEMFALDLDEQKVLHRVGDENAIIPSGLTKALRVALEVTKNSVSPVEKNVAVSEAVLRLYVELIGRYDDFIFRNHKTKCREFLRDQFVRSGKSKNTQLFLEWFSETAMFKSYIESKLIGNYESRGRFEQLCLDYCDENRRAREKKEKGFTVKNLGEIFKGWAASQ